MVICWMAGLFYLPRLFVYHIQAAQDAHWNETFKAMEARLMKIIINPSMIGTFIFGGALLSIPGYIDWGSGWIHLKLVFVFLLVGFHAYLSLCRKKFSLNQNKKSAKFYRILNEIPPLIMIIIVILVVVKPF